MFQEQFAAVKRANKVRLAELIKDRLKFVVSPDALFDVQVKRIHEYKRQLLNVIEAVAQYPGDQVASGSRLGAAREGVRRQGGAELLERQADHQADQ